MKKVTLKSLTLVNFKGEKERTTVFNADVTTISGGNGLGKSRHFDAFIWLLFGKDSQDRKDYEVKTRVNGEELHKVECSVTGILDVDGQELTLKRAFVEDWVKPRGQVEQRYKGNHTECWWNETPVNVSEFDKRVHEIVDSNVFKMITNPAFFVGMNWKLQREQLFQLAGTITDVEIASSNPDFALLLDKISGKSLADFKAEIAARKKRLKNELNQVQPRIDQTYKMIPETEDFAALESKLADIDKEIASIDEMIADANAAIRKSYEAEQEKQGKMNALKAECQQIIFDAQTAAKDKAFEANANRRELESQIKVKKSEIEAVKREMQLGKSEIDRHNAEIEKLVAEQKRLRDEWYNENAKRYQGETICPHCGQELPQSMIDEAQSIFTKAQAEKCNGITAKGKEVGEKIATQHGCINQVENGYNEAETRLNALQSELDGLKTDLDSTTVAEVATVTPETIPAWVEKQKQISEIQSTISTDNSGIDTSEMQTKKKGLNEIRSEIVARLGKRDTIERGKREIARLESDGKNLAQQIADIEREEYTIQEFNKTKIGECEKRINSLFKVVSFRLFEYTLDGNPNEVCVPLVGGVPYGSTNTAGKVNAGLDIINALCRFYGICAPIFIDNRESVNEIIETESQIINLVVTNDNKLTIK
ncbi:AAA family ATPase [Prevotella sp.]|uniref:AAA family ATPase n=1 Tax=Prevotella sp. TaxID=59823 RepID=UPI002F94FB3B